MNDCNSAPRHDQAAIQSAAPSLGLEVSPVNVRDASDIERDVTAFAHSSLKILRLQKNPRMMCLGALQERFAKRMRRATRSVVYKIPPSVKICQLYSCELH